MGYNRLFYLNITYECNNRCIFCISHNTTNRTRKVENPLEIIKAVNTKYSFAQNDLFIVNGGEPTTSPYFAELLDYLLATPINIIVYSNGRKLSKYLHYTANERIRWIVAFYGLQDIHDKYTSVQGSFLETFNSLQSISRENKKRVSVKFLIEDESQIADFRELAKILTDYNEIHISLVLNKNRTKRFELSKAASSFIEELIETHTVKLSNYPLCSIFSNAKKEYKETKIETYYFIDEEGIVKQIDYDKNHNWLEKCNDCAMLSICCDSYKKYRALRISKSELSLEEE